ncbi:MAG: hypothetical protein IJS15_16480 [Victivallales bacterium]|nr:hypothetical protein [Victivallales bacterium]
MAYSAFLYSGDTLLLEKDVISEITLGPADGDYLLLKSGGLASSITVSQDCLLKLENGSRADNIRLLSEGVCIVDSGAFLDFLTIDCGGICNLHGRLETADVSGALYLYDTASLCTAIVDTGGLLSIWGSGCDANDIIVSGTASVYHGTISNAYAIDGGRFRLGADAKANDITIYGGCSIDVSSGATINNLTVRANGFARLAPGATLTGLACLAAPLSITGEINAVSADFILLPEEDADTETPIIPDWRLCAPRSISISISENLQPGNYRIADNLDNIITIPIINQLGAKIGKCTTSARLCHDDYILSLEFIDGSLTFHAQYCNYTRINSTLTLRTDDDGLAIFTHAEDMPETLSWSKKTEIPEELTTYITPETSKWDASALERPAVFFAKPISTWGHDYLALNVNTGERNSITGKKRFDGIFIGSSTPSLLMLTPEDDAIFSDDIFTPFPESTERQSRLSMIAEIRAEDGDDIIDMTNEHFPDTNQGIVLRGGRGNDVIWAANDGSCLFGDLGDDLLTGGCANDMLCGGSGNDTLRGFSGFDIYAFGFDAGNDTILLDDGDFILWFEEGISISEDDISIEGDTALIAFGSLASVTINNLPDDRLMERIVLGDTCSFADIRYSFIANLGAFDSDSSQRTFNAIA